MPASKSVTGRAHDNESDSRPAYVGGVELHRRTDAVEA